MRVGDLVKFKNDGFLGLVVEVAHQVDGWTRWQSVGRRVGGREPPRPGIVPLE